jgi:CheY-like chemotaxis protein
LVFPDFGAVLPAIWPAMTGNDSTARDGPECEAPEATAATPAAALIPDVEPRGEAHAARETLEAARRNVLLVEDEALVALDMVDALERLGWSVIGPAATLEEAQVLVSSGLRFDAAVLDVNLQGRWVHALAEELAARGVPFVVCTGYEMVDPEGRFADAPVIAKPIIGDLLAAALDALLAGAEPEPDEPEPLPD